MVGASVALFVEKAIYGMCVALCKASRTLLNICARNGLEAFVMRNYSSWVRLEVSVSSRLVWESFLRKGSVYKTSQTRQKW